MLDFLQAKLSQCMPARVCGLPIILVPYVWVALAIVSPSLLGHELQTAREERPTITVYLMPNEPAALDVGDNISIEITEFNKRWGENLVVLNTTVARLHEQLYAPSPEYAAPNWSVVKGQSGTLAALEEFATEAGITIYVRILTWGSGLAEIRLALQQAPSSIEYPDVVQIGTTWRGALATDGAILAPATDQQGQLKWRSIGATKTLPYTQDVRVIWYWRRPIDESSNAPSLRLDDESWDSILSSITEYLSQPMPPHPGEPIGRGRPAMVFPILLDPNVMHDYAPLVWSGGGTFLLLTGKHPWMDLTSKQALHVPKLLAKNVWQHDREGRKFRLLAFVETSHFAAMNHFIAGEWTAIVEPVGFLPYLREHYVQRWRNLIEKQLHEVNDGAPLTEEQREDASRQAGEKGRRIFDHIGVAVPPENFKGGSDLVVTPKTSNPDLAFRVARFLAKPESEWSGEFAVSYSRILTDRGFLPSQFDDPGIDSLLRGLDLVENATEVRPTLIRAIEGGRSYPDGSEWAASIERLSHFEQFQSIWRRIAGGDPLAVQSAAQVVQDTINYEINPVFRAKVDSNRPEVLAEKGRRMEAERQAAIIAVVVAGAVLIGLGFVAVRERRHRSRERRSLGLLSMMSTQLDDRHRRSRAWVQRRVRPGILALQQKLEQARQSGDSNRVGELENELKRVQIRNNGNAERAELLITGLRDLGRALATEAKGPLELKDTVWQSIIRAIDNVDQDQEGIHDEWLTSNRTVPIPVFLANKGLLREDRLSAEAKSFFFDFAGPVGVRIRDVVVVEFCLATLLQNAITASVHPSGYHEAIEVHFEITPEPILWIRNANHKGRVLDPVIVGLLNTRPFDPVNAEATLREYFRNTPEDQWIGLGLIVTKSIAETFLGGLYVDITDTRANIGLGLGNAYAA